MKESLGWVIAIIVFLLLLYKWECQPDFVQTQVTKIDTVYKVDTVVVEHPPLVLYKVPPTHTKIVYDTLRDTVTIKYLVAELDTIVASKNYYDTLKIAFTYPPPLFSIDFRRSADSVFQQTVYITKTEYQQQKTDTWREIGIGAAGFIIGGLFGYIAGKK